MSIIEIYKNHIYNRFKDLLRAKKIEDLDNNDLCKIFEYFSCIKLTEEYKTAFYEYADIDPEFKELNQMSRNDTGIDCSNLIDTIVQCKLRKDTLTWKECSTFFASQNVYNEELNKTIVRWDNLIITRNSECKLAMNLQEKKRLFNDKPYSRDEIINYCEKLLETPPMTSIENIIKYVVRYYQEELIKKIIDGQANIIISIPTGTGKNFIIVHSLEPNKKYLILVPRIILMEQMQDEIKKHKPKLKYKIQLIGDSKNVFDETKDITICCYNSVKIVEGHSSKFHKIFIDEAHHISKPEIYQNDEQDLEDPARKDDDEYYDSDEEYDDEEYSDNEEDNEDSEDEDNVEDNEETPLEDDDNEIKDESTYIDIIRNFAKLNNNVYLSATIDPQEGFTYYEKNIRDMINNKYLCDYTINIPIFTDDPTNKNICEYLLKEYRNIIIYCNTKKEGKQINKLMNELQKKSSEYIDCDTTKTKRKTIIDKFKIGELPFLVNVRILVEGFDAPITKGVCFMHLPSSKTTLIQIIGRALRLHKDKTNANIILPYSSKEDESSITNFMKVIAKNDSRIKKSLENKKVGGYISLVKVIEDENDDDEENEELRDINFKYELIFDSIGIMKNSEEIFVKRLEECKKYIDINKQRPTHSNKFREIKVLGRWLQNQKTNYNKKIGIMKLENIYKLWTEFITCDKYKIYFLSQEELFNVEYNKLIEYIEINKELPSQYDNNIYIKKLGRWVCGNKKTYKTKTEKMSNEIIYNKWHNFINNDKYKVYFDLPTSETLFIKHLTNFKNYINIHKKTPSNNDKNREHKLLANWYSNQKNNYKNKENNMIIEYIYNEWEKFINDDTYKIYLKVPEMEELFDNNLSKLKNYIDTYNKLPSILDENKEIKTLGSWTVNNKIKYKKKFENMSYPNIYDKWTQFINDEKYKEYMLSEEEIFNINLNNIINYIDTYNQRPISSSNNKDKKIKYLGQCILRYNKCYKTKSRIMKDEKVYKKWESFINDDKYKVYFHTEIEMFNINLQKLKNFIDSNKKRPSSTSENKDESYLNEWISTQTKYCNKKDINDERYKEWNNFINDEKYKKYFQTPEENFYKLFLELKTYLDINHSRPSHKQIEYSHLARFYNTYNIYYTKKQHVMKNENIYKQWSNFLKDKNYNKYFLSNEDEWKLNLLKIKDYIDKNNKRPSKHSGEEDIKFLGNWTSSQIKNYKSKTCIMKDETIYKLWTDFINNPKYKDYFK